MTLNRRVIVRDVAMIHMESMNEIKGENVVLYKHYKGGLYREIGEGVHTETNEELTIYMSVETGKLYARPTDMFHELVNHKDALTPRFREIIEY